MAMDPGPDIALQGFQVEQLRAMIDAFQRSGRTIESVIVGNSMGSTLPHGCRIRIDARKPEEFLPGQIAACYQNGLLFAHRVVAFHGGYLLTQGDGWILCDQPLPVSALLGQVTGYWDGADWRVLRSTPGRCPSDQRHAEFHARLALRCLKVHPVLARLTTRRMLTLYTGKEILREWLKGA